MNTFEKANQISEKLNNAGFKTKLESSPKSESVYVYVFVIDPFFNAPAHKKIRVSTHDLGMEKCLTFAELDAKVLDIIENYQPLN